MKLKKFLTLGLAGISFCAMAQTHLDGEEYYKADQFNNAYDLLLRSLNNPQTDKAVSDYYLGMIEIKGKNNQKAAEFFSQGVAANPNYAYNYVGQGLLKLMAGDKKAAESLFKEAQKHAKKDASLEVAIASAYNSVDPVKYEKEIAKQIEKARKYDLQNPDIYIYEGDILREEAYNVGDQVKSNQIIGSAAAKYEMAKNYDSNSTPAYVKYANLFTDVKPSYAITMLNELLKNNPNSALGQRELARAYENNRDYKKAVEQYGKYVQNPSHFKSDESKYALLLFSDGQYQKGYDYATSLLAQDPSNFTAQRYQFMNAAQLDELKDQRLAMADKLYADHKSNPSKNQIAAIDYNLIAGEFQDAKRLDDAIAVMDEAMKELPEYAPFNKVLAGIYIDKEDYGKAADTYLGYFDKTKSPAYNDFIQEALYSYYGADQNIKSNPSLANKYLDMATDYANKAMQADPSQYKPYYILGEVAMLKSNPADAVSNYEKALSILDTADKSRATNDMKRMYSSLQNYYAGKGDNAKATEYKNKYQSLQ